MAKYGQGLQFIIAGDTNRLNLSPILNLSPSLKQVVQTATRLNPPVILDPIITTMKKLYQPPVTKPPLNNDEDKQGKPSDHLVVVMYPINAQLGCPPRQTRIVECRPLPQSGINKMGEWIQKQTWNEIYQCNNANQKAEMLQSMLLRKLDEFLPVKSTKFTSDDKPWATYQIKELDRKAKREFFKNHKSRKWTKLSEDLDAKCSTAKENYYQNMVKDLKESNQNQWYSKVNRMGGIPDSRTGNIFVEELEGISDKDQAEMIAEHYSSVSNEYKALEKKDIPHELYKTNEKAPKIEAYEMYLKIEKMSTKKACVKGDIPMKVIKEFSVELAEPLAHILTFGLANGQYPDIWKFETITPAFKIYPPEKISQLRKISGLKNFAKICDSFLAEFMTKDMLPHADPAQYGNRKGLSTQHYLVKMINRILTATDKNSKDEAKAVIVQMIDWKSAFDRQCHKQGILSFIKNGVRKSLIPILILYFQNRKMAVKWNGEVSKQFNLPGGGAQGEQLGQLEYISQSDDNVDFLNMEDKYKFIDDLSIIEVINLAMCGISGYNFKQHVASDIGSHGQYLPIESVESQTHLDKIQHWTEEKMMALNKSKTKFMVINFTKKFQFNTRITLDGVSLEEVNECKLLGKTVNNQLTWHQNTESMIKKANTRMLILHKLYEFNLPADEMVNIYILFIRSIVEYCCVVWHNSITEEESNHIERVQKIALRIILNEDYTDYSSALELSGIETLKQRRTRLSHNFAKKCIKSNLSSDLFPLNIKAVNTRPHEKYHVTPARTERLAKSTIPYLQRLLNVNS